MRWRGSVLLNHSLRRSRHRASASLGHAHHRRLTCPGASNMQPPTSQSGDCRALVHCLRLTGVNVSEDVRTLPEGSQEVACVCWGGSNASTHHHRSPRRSTGSLGPFRRREKVPGHPRKESRITNHHSSPEQLVTLTF